MNTVVLLLTSPRLPAGLLTAQAWDLVRSAPVYAGAGSDQVDALRAAGVEVTVVEPADAARTLLSAEGTAVWLAGPDGDPTVAHELAQRVAADPTAAELEACYGSWDPPGARLLDVVAVMDRLRSPGGCPWDAEQTHLSLAPYLLEEAYEAYDAIHGHPDGPPAHEAPAEPETDTVALREELGDVLLQIAFHARVAEELPDGRRWTIDDVAGDLVAKLVRRHPHVFADRAVSGSAEVEANWDDIKRAEKAAKGSSVSATAGVALSQPALSLAAKYLSRAERAGVDAPPPPLPDGVKPPTDTPALGDLLLALVAAAHAHGLDAEAALRAAALSHADRIRVRERLSS